MRYFLTFDNNYRVYWAWTKYRITAPIGQISRPNHQPDPASLWLVDGGGRIKWQYWSIWCVFSLIIVNIAELMEPRGAVSVVWRLIRAVVCGRTTVTQGHGNLSFSSTFHLTPPHCTCLLSSSCALQGDRNTLGQDKTMVTNNKQHQLCSCNIKMSLLVSAGYPSIQWQLQSILYH